MPEQNLEAIIDDLDGLSDGGEVSVGDLVDRMQDRPVGVLLAIIGLFALIPFIGGLPGAPVVLALLTLGVVAQSQIQSAGIWLPDAIRRRSFDADRLGKGLKHARPWASRIDRLTGRRLTALADSSVARRVILGIVVCLAVAMVPLGLIPAGIAPAALAILVFGLALMARDGLLALVGYLLTAAAAWMVVTLL